MSGRERAAKHRDFCCFPSCSYLALKNGLTPPLVMWLYSTSPSTPEAMAVDQNFIWRATPKPRISVWGAGKALSSWLDGRPRKQNCLQTLCDMSEPSITRQLGDKGNRAELKLQVTKEIRTQDHLGLYPVQHWAVLKLSMVQANHLFLPLSSSSISLSESGFW